MAGGLAIRFFGSRLPPRCRGEIVSSNNNAVWYAVPTLFRLTPSVTSKGWCRTLALIGGVSRHVCSAYHRRGLPIFKMYGALSVNCVCLWCSTTTATSRARP